MNAITLITVLSFSPLQMDGGESGTNTLQLIMLIAAIAGLTILMISTYRRIRSARRPGKSTVQQRYAELRGQQSAKRGVEEVMLELDQLSRQIHGRLDTKLVRLELLIRDADERIDRLARAVRSADGRAAVEVTIGRESPHDPAHPMREAEPDPHTTIHGLADDGLEPAEIAQKTGKPIGEVELILALRKVKQPADRPGRIINSAR